MKTSQEKLAVYEGKAKRIAPHGLNEVAIFFKDDVTAHNGAKHAVVPGKGALNSRISELLFDYLTRMHMANHYVRRHDANTLICQRADMLHLEVVVRFAVAGSLAKRTGLKAGMVCSPPVVEFYYKNDALGDPLLNHDHIRLLDLASLQDVRLLSDMALTTAQLLHGLFASVELHLLDIKLEFGKMAGKLLLADEISPDTCRLHRIKDGTVLDKDRFRLELGDLLVGYTEIATRLQQAPQEVL